MHIHHTHRHHEQGVALLLTLGILALLLMLALSFALTARTDRQAASVNADMIKARLLAGSGLERALGFLSYGHEDEVYPGTWNPGLGGFFARGHDTNHNLPWFQHRYMVSEGPDDTGGLERAMGIRFFTQNPARTFRYTPHDSLPDDDGVEPSWHHIKNRDDELVGRIAFLVIDESGKINPNIHLYYEDNDPDYYDHEHPLFRVHNELDNYAYRYNHVNTANSVGWNAIPTTMDRWYSWFQLIGTPGLTTADRATAISRRFFPWSRGDETFWCEDTGNRNRPRLRLRHLGWDTTSVSAVRDQVPWIAGLQSTDGTSSSIIRNQVAANLIAYSSSPETPPPTDLAIGDDGWNNDRAAWPVPNYAGWPVAGTDDPGVTYLGRKAVPYINEVAIDVRMSYDEGTEKYLLDIGIEPELINIYPDGEENCNLTLMLRFEGIPGQSGGQDTGLPPLAPPLRGVSTDGAVLHWSNITVPANGYAVPAKYTLTYIIEPASFEAGVPAPVPIPVPIPGDPPGLGDRVPATLEISDFTVRAFAVVRNAETIGDDPATPPNVIPWDAADMGTSPEAELTADNVSIGNQYINFSAGDPRANTLPPHWQILMSSTVPNATTGGLNTNNPAADPRTGDDLETVNDPAAGISTAFVRSGPMESLWELGAIHRGEPWQTLNLTAFNDGTENRTWENGDAAVLDQAALAGGPYRINVNTHVEQVLRSLFDGVTRGGFYDDPWSGTVIDPAALPAGLINEFRFRNRGTGEDHEDAFPFINRGEIARVEALSDGDTQREQEELIGKIAHLLTTRSNFFRVVVTAQTVMDLGSPPVAVRDGRNVFRYDSGDDLWCRVMAEQKIMAIVYRDAFNNTYRILRYEYLED